MAYSINSTNDGCYEGTNCLINKFDIRDDKVLQKIESEIVFAKSAILEKEPISGDFSFEHYKAVHKFLFEDIYQWASNVRTVDISKKGTKFVNASEIEELGRLCFERIAKENYFKDYKPNRYIKRITTLYCDTNILHPFREGNGRCQRAFLTQLIRYAGYDINFSEIDPDDLMIATILSAQGVTDHIKAIFKNSIKFTQDS